MQRVSSANPFSLGSESQENQDFAPVVAVHSEREFAIADENVAEEAKLDDTESNPFGQAVSSAKNSFTFQNTEPKRKSRQSILARPGSIFIPKESQADDNNHLSDNESDKVAVNAH